ncbi:MAG: MoaD/ThiS family protein [Bacillota bacterium]
MFIEVCLYAGLRKYAPGVALGEHITMEIPEGSTGLDLLRVIGIPAGEGQLFIINSSRVEPDVDLREGDRVGIFPPLGGG